MKYHNITHDDMLNGEGLRVVLWVSGCSHHCKNCQNPITWNPDDGKEFGEDEMKEIFNELNHDYISGITLSGGDPLNEHNLSTILELVELIRAKYGHHKTIWIYSGYTIEEIMNGKDDPINTLRRKILSNCDIFVDGKFEENLADIKYEYAGSTNQRIIDIKKSELCGWRNIIQYNHRLTTC